ncbi:MAG: cobyrinate a,c-diamide synthase [Clostridiaceae bacterium]
MREKPASAEFNDYEGAGNMDKERMKCLVQDSQAVSVRFPRIMIAAEKSGGGKTLLTCALLSLLKERVQAVRAFKCGPDYIDPMFHRTVLEIPSRNLDSFFADEDTLRYLLGREVLEMEKFPESRIAVLEGVMGFYDGLGGVLERSSAWEVADLTDTPVILLVDMKGRSLSALASIKGFLDYKEKSHVTGVIFNRLSPMLYPGLKERAERELGIRVFGYVPELKDMTLESRHLGLVMPEEILGIRERLDLIKEKVRVGINLDGIIEEAGRAAEIEVKLPEAVRQFCNVDCGKVLNNSAAQHIENIANAKKIYDSGNTHEVKSTLSDRSVKKTVVAVAKDKAFCFYYEDNLNLLKKLGAEIQYFSPIHDRNLPEGTCAVYLGGGYPELHAKALSENISMRNAIRQAVMEEVPCIAECGGYLYLKDSIVDPDGVEWPMAGVLPGGSRDTGKLGRFGYITVTSKKEGLLGPAGTEFRAHEFHHWDSEENGTDFAAKKPVGTRGWDCGYTTESFYAGFPHLYFYSNVKIAENFIKCAETWKKKNLVVK